MSGNLEDFLRQAAQRRQQRSTGQSKQPPAARSVRQSERARPFEAEFIEPEEEGESVTRRITQPSPVQTPSISPTIAPRTAKPSEVVDQADERMAKHVKDWLVHPVSQLNQANVTSGEVVTATIVAPSEAPKSSQAIDTQHRLNEPHPLVSQLRNPNTLKAAFVAGEIFKRKF